MVETLFTQALGLTPPWEVVEVKFAPTQRRIDFHLACKGKHVCPACGAGGAVLHDSTSRQWRHLDFFQFEAYIHADVPRVRCGQCGQVSTVTVPWARPGSRFTLLFEALAMSLAPTMSVANLARMLRVVQDRLWRVIGHYVAKARAQESHAEVKKIGVDETAAKRGHEYITVCYDLDVQRLLFATPGKDQQTVARIVEDLKAHQGDPAQITHVSMDMSAAFQAGVAEHLPEAAICFDRFHVVALANTALDEVRRAEQRSGGEERFKLKKLAWALRKDARDWTEQQLNRMHHLQRSNLQTGRAWRIKEALRDIYRTAGSPQEAEPLLKKWCSWAARCRLEPMKKVAATIKKHWRGVLSGFNPGCHNGKVEAMNRALQEARARARGYRKTENFINMAYLIAGKLRHLPVSPFQAPAT